MIRVFVLAFGFALIALPALAAGANFGTYTCRQQVPCADNGTIPKEQWATLAGQCMSNGFGYGNASLFDTTGLDSSGCVPVIGAATSAPGTGGAKLFPHCCLFPVDSQKCVIQCRLMQE